AWAGTPTHVASTGWPSLEAAAAAIESLRALGPAWHGTYRIIEVRRILDRTIVRTVHLQSIVDAEEIPVEEAERAIADAARLAAWRQEEQGQTSGRAYDEAQTELCDRVAVRLGCISQLAHDARDFDPSGDPLTDVIAALAEELAQLARLHTALR